MSFCNQKPAGRTHIERQLDGAGIYTNKRIMKKFKTEHYADYDSAIHTGSSSDDCDEEPARTWELRRI